MKDNKHIQSFGQFNENLNISDVSCSFGDEIYRLKEFWERRFINGNDIKILENEVKNLSEKYGKNLSLSHNYGVNKDNRIYVSINCN